MCIRDSAKGATSVITTGAAQSNHARMTAAAARRAGLAVDLVLTTADDPAPLEGNLLLDHLFGARVHMVPAVDPMLAVGHDEAVVRDVAEGLVAAGGRPYVIAVGDTLDVTGLSRNGRGVEPDFVVVPLQSDLIAAKDTVFEAALAWIREELAQ